MDRTRYCLNDLCDNDLLAGITRLAADDHARLADLLAHLAEVDSRKLYVGLSFASLFAYCTSALGYSEDETYKRIQAARAARAHPLIFELVAKGELHLSAINLVAPHLTPENYEELLVTACNKSKRAVEEVVAARFPRPDVATSLRKLPSPLPTAAAASSPSPAPSLAAQLRLTEPASPAAPLPKETGEDAPAAAAPAMPAIKSAPRATLEALSAERYRLQLTLGRDTRDKLLRAQALLRHQLPDGDLGAVLDQAVSLLCAKLESRKFGKKRQSSSAARAPEPAPAHAGQETIPGCDEP